MHFYESSIITTKDGLHCQVYANEHPTNSILVKPKYIPTEKVESSAMQYRFISGKKMNRLNLWADKSGLKSYIEHFKEKYPQYLFNSTVHGSNHENGRLIFSVPIDYIERVYFPRTGLKELMSMPVEALDDHLKTVHDFVQFLINSGLNLHDLGITYSTLMGHYASKVSDINIVVYGKEKFWALMNYLETAKHPSLRWKTQDEWLDFYKKRNRYSICDKDLFIKSASRKKSEGFFNETLFVIFAAEREEEVHARWGSEKYVDKGLITVQGTVADDFHSVVRPGYYEITDSSTPNVTQITFHSRDYCMLAKKGEKMEACGILEEVIPAHGKSYHRVVVGYFDSYLNERREKEFIRLIT